MIERFFMERPEDRARWQQYREVHPGLVCVDRFDAQLAELFSIDHPEHEPKTPVFDTQLADYRRVYYERTPLEATGVWVVYPWRSTAVRLLPPEEFFRVRTARNRNIVTAEDQQKFRGLAVGIAGLSIGNSIAIALALQGGADTLVLADHDVLEVSNLNRLNMPITGLGENKAVLTARRIYKINPYANIILYTDGLHEHNLRAFVQGPPKLDVLIDEIDNLAMKWRLREAAAAARIPLLMATCMGERVLLDVERYDENPRRRFFVKAVRPDFLDRARAALSRAEWMELTTQIVGADETLPEVRATNEEIGKSVTTRPLFGGTAVAAGGVVAKAVRAIATGQLLSDGRHRLDLTPTPAAVPVGRGSPPRSDWNVEAWERALENKPARYFEQLGAAQALRTFRLAAARVPAYRDFLKKNRVDTERIRTIDDFKTNVPIMDKENYLRAYPLAALCVDGEVHRSPMISVSSGSSGRAFFWPRGSELEREGAFLHELLFRNSFGIQHHSTLVVVGFSMGTWIAGTYTKACVMGFSPRGYRINVATPGIEIEDIIPLIQEFSGSFEQIILAGYPPFVKDVVEALREAGTPLPPRGIKFLFAGEGFSEGWRSAVLSRAGCADPLNSSASIYGTADAAILGHETPLSINIRRFLSERQSNAERMFEDERLPTLVQYHPQFKYFETTDGELIFTARGGFPLVRYNIHDKGGVLPHDDFMSRLKEDGFMAAAAATRKWKLPFLYLFGRSQAATTIYAVNIYLENIQAALAEPELHPLVSGKSVMGNGYDDEWDQYWWLKVEAARGVAVTREMAERIGTVVTRVLAEKNSEFRRLHAAVGTRALPRVTVLPHSAPEFHLKVKHRWSQPTPAPTR